MLNRSLTKTKAKKTKKSKPEVSYNAQYIKESSIEEIPALFIRKKKPEIVPI